MTLEKIAENERHKKLDRVNMSVLGMWQIRVFFLAASDQTQKRDLWECIQIENLCKSFYSQQLPYLPSIEVASSLRIVSALDVVFRQIEIVLKDSTAFIYVTKSEKSSHFTLMTWFFTLRYINKGCGIF